MVKFRLRRTDTKRYAAQLNRRRIAPYGKTQVVRFASRSPRIGAQSNLHRARLHSGGSRIRYALARNKAPCIRPTPRAIKLAL